MVFAIVLAFMFTGTPQAADGGRMTDDPQGRVRIPLAENSGPTMAATEMFGTFNAEDNAQAMAMEELKQTEAVGSPLVIPAAGFSADGSNPDSHFFPFGGGYFQGGADAYGCLVAPAYLPAGVVLEDMYVSVYDDDATFNITIELRRVDNFNGGTDTMATASSTGEFTGVQTILDATIDFPTVIYPDYSYYVTTCVLSGSIRLYSVRLYY